MLAILLGQLRDVGAIGSREIARHPLVEVEERGSGAQLRPHVADGALAGGADREAPGPKYSTILLVPPLTVRTPRRCVITSLAEVHPGACVSRPDEARIQHFHASPAMPRRSRPRPHPDGDHAEARPSWGMDPPDQSPPGKA